jgi:molybdopterin-guanine dinucleotide biosynthesis protein MobB
MREFRGEGEPSLEALLSRLAPVDIVVVEGFRHSAHPKIEIHRPELGKPVLHPDDPMILAVAAPEPIAGMRVPWLPLDDPEAIADFVLAYPRFAID